QGPHGLSHQVRAAVQQVVAVDHRQHDVFELQLADGPRHVLRLAGIIRAPRVPRRYRAETAAAGTRVTQEHHGCRARTPALTHVWTAGLFADRVQIELTQRLRELRVAL